MEPVSDQELPQLIAVTVKLHVATLYGMLIAPNFCASATNGWLGAWKHGFSLDCYLWRVQVPHS